MQIWLDTIDLNVIADGVETGIISGVTTNPSILSNSINVLETLDRILDLQPGPIAVQVTGQSPHEMIDEARHIYQHSNRLVIKVPLSRKGLIAMKQLRHEQIPVLGTAILYPTQALLAANMGVAYISPYFCHIGDTGNAFEILKTMVDLVRASTSKTKILVASLKHLDHLIYCALLGVDGVTIKPDLYHKLIADFPMVEGFTEKFLSDWMQSHGSSSIKDTLQKT